MISGTGGVVNQSGSGALVLSGANTYTGATNVTAGTLDVTSTGSLAAGSTVNVATGGTLAGAGIIHGKATLTGSGAIDFAAGGTIAGTLAVVPVVTGTVWGRSPGWSRPARAPSPLSAARISPPPQVWPSPEARSPASGTLTGNLTDTEQHQPKPLAGSSPEACGHGHDEQSVYHSHADRNEYLWRRDGPVTAGTLQVGDGAATTRTPSRHKHGATTAAAGTLTTDLAGGESFSNGVVDNGHVVATGTTNNYKVSSAISGTGNLTKTGTNTVTLTGVNTYKGGTADQRTGTLLVNNTSGSGTGSGAVAINNGGTLGGSGTISGATTLNNGGTLFPGAGSVGTPGTTLHASSLIWNGGGTVTLQLGASVDDALVLTGALTKGSAGAYNVDILDDGGIPLGNYTLATFASTTFSATTFQLELPGNYVGHLVETSTQLILDVTAGSGQQPAQFDSVAAEATIRPRREIPPQFRPPPDSDRTV